MASKERLIIGLDLGQQYDYTVLTAISAVFVSKRDMRYKLEYIHRYPLKMSYPDMGASVTRFMNSAKVKLHNPILIVDYTGVGAPVYDILIKNGLAPVGLTVTGGLSVNITNRYKIAVPKRDLVASLQIVIQNKKIVIPSSLKEYAQLVAEVQNFSMDVTKGSSPTFNALRDNVHDDIIMSLCMATWYAEDMLSGKKSPFIATGI